MDLEVLESSIGYKFENKRLLKTALTHTSYANERNIDSNEKFEFIGDSILQMVSSLYIYEKYKELKEGEMTKVRASVVCGESLLEIANRHGFSDFLYLGRSEVYSKNKKSILEDSVEAVIAAIYLDGGLESARKFILYNLVEKINVESKNVGVKDYKTSLQEKLQKNGDVKIEYVIINEEGPDHDKKFDAQVLLNGVKLAEGSGKSKKEAQMEAAKNALDSKALYE